MHPKDEYNEATGLKVSMAKAEIVAYKKVSQWIASLMSLIIDRGFYTTDLFFEHAAKVIKHDEKFLKQF
jgi:hypothetical protein